MKADVDRAADDGNRVVSGFITGITWDRLPPGARSQARLALLDTLGAALAGTLTLASRIATDLAVEVWPGDEATLLLRDRRASAIGAAFANGYAANGLDIDDCAIYTKGHPGAQILPTALALAESLGLGGAEMLTGLVVGYEVAHRAARIWHATHDVYQACGSWGSVACAAVAAHLTGLSEEQTRHALGIAEYHAPNLPMMRDIDHPSMVKHGIGWGAMTGIVAARLAARGFSGIPSLFGFTDVANEGVRDWVSDIGHHYIMAEGLAWKRYGCCAWIHAALKAAEELQREHRFRAEDIDHIRVEAFHEAVRLGAELPTTTEEAQFNMAWPLAALLTDGEVGPAQTLEPGLGNPQIRDLARRVELVETEELSRLYRLATRGDPRGKYASRVTIVLRDGTALDSGPVEGDINYPQRCWDRRDLEDKFRWLARPVLDETRIDALVEMIRRFEDIEHVRQLTQLLA